MRKTKTYGVRSNLTKNENSKSVSFNKMDDQGNIIWYKYVPQDSASIDLIDRLDELEKENLDLRIKLGTLNHELFELKNMGFIKKFTKWIKE